MHASNLDIERFAKLRAHATGNENAGERGNARRMAEAMAAKAGMTFDQAVSAMEGQTTAKKWDFGGYDWAEAFSAKAQQQAERNRKARAVKRKEVLTRYRTMFDVFEPTAWERALRVAIEPFSQFIPYQSPAGHKHRYTSKLDRCKGEVNIDKLTNRAEKAIRGAYPMPTTFASALAEVKAWDRLRLDREAFCDGEWQHDMEVEGRVCLVEDMLANDPAATWDDLEARFEWDNYKWKRQWLNPDDHARLDNDLLRRIRADISILRTAATSPCEAGEPDGTPGHRVPVAQNGQRRTNADKPTDVRSMLANSPELSDREIARRAGVSPQTVSNWRARLSQGQLFAAAAGANR